MLKTMLKTKKSEVQFSMNKKLLKKACAALAAVTVFCSIAGCGGTNTQTSSTTSVSSTTAAAEAADFRELPLNNPEYIEGVKFLSQKDTQYKNSPLFEKVLVYNYNLDRNYFTVNSKLESKTIIDQYKKDLEKKYNLLFNDDKRYGENAAICECKLKGAASMYILVCEGDFDVGNNADFSVVLCTPKEDKGFSDEEFDAYKDEPGANSKNFVGFWKSLFYLFDNGSTSNTDMYSIFTYNTGSASLYVNYEKYAGTWKEDNDFYTFTFGDLKGEGKMETVNGKEYLVIDFDGVRGRVAFEMVY